MFGGVGKNTIFKSREDAKDYLRQAFVHLMGGEGSANAFMNIAGALDTPQKQTEECEEILIEKIEECKSIHEDILKRDAEIGRSQRFSESQTELYQQWAAHVSVFQQLNETRYQQLKLELGKLREVRKALGLGKPDYDKDHSLPVVLGFDNRSIGDIIDAAASAPNVTRLSLRQDWDQLNGLYQHFVAEGFGDPSP